MNFSKKQNLLWLAISLLMSFLLSLRATARVFQYDFVIQDDARQHVVWFEQYLDKYLFQGDMIADYFQSVAPPGYSYLYKTIGFLGISPIQASKLLPILLYVLTAFFCYRLTIKLFKFPTGGFFSTSILLYTLLFQTDISSATPRAFLNLFLLAFLYSLTCGSRLGSWFSLLFLGLYYPQAMLVAAGTGILSLFRLNGWRIKLTSDKNLMGLVIGVIAIALVFSAYFLLLRDSEFGPVVTRVQALVDPAYLKGGRSSFFSESALEFWLLGGRSGLVPGGFLFFQPRLLLVCLLLPFLWVFRRDFPLIKQVSKRISILLRLLIASVFLYSAAHFLLFKLHLPSRYTQHGIRIIMAILSGITLAILVDAVRIWLARSTINFVRAISPFVYLTFVALILIYPVYLNQTDADFPKPGYVIGRYPKIYQFFSEQPKDTLVASLSKEVANIPAFSTRSVLVAPEYGVAYHRGYYEKFRQKVKDLMAATFSEDKELLNQFIEQYGVDFFMLEKEIFAEGYFIENNDWPMEYEAFIEAIKKGTEPRSALAATVGTCTALESKNMLVLDAVCVTEHSK